jgi:hypothetical protein
MILMGQPAQAMQYTAAQQFSSQLTSEHADGFKMPFVTIGRVESNDDPDQLGRMKVYCPAVDSEVHTPESLPWAKYVTPFAGTTENLEIGPTGEVLNGSWAYGFWAIPKVGSHVLIMFVDGDPNNRVWMGGVFAPPLGKSLFAGLTSNDKGEPGNFSEELLANDLTEKQLTEAGLNKNSVWKTRGGYERQAGADITDGTEGYAKYKERLDPQTYGITTPGRHFFIMSDVPEHCRVRLRSTTGHQIIMDDTNERMYISTSSGKSWIELDNDGHVHVYSGESFSINAETDINMTAGGGIFMKAKSIHQSAQDINSSACCVNVKASDKVYIESSSESNIKSGGALNFSGSPMNLNSGDVPGASEASAPGIVPKKEPWSRPKTRGVRNKFWRP